ncbi:LAGLIDADG family homing endonuclease [Cryobacterium sp. Sr8]|uniref:LAGLIDADG family homing endonuclease n=1 Tax=Cryobacterium sp. Sr8 TaxID=1259203 RepID=UPI00141B623A|nr:LAGLIDADG family homing endonuclease [Cryobacterium sp. Sr8]
MSAFPESTFRSIVRERGVVTTMVSGGTVRGGVGGTPAGGLLTWLRELELKTPRGEKSAGGSLSDTKFVPKSFLEASLPVIQELVGALWDTDGCIFRFTKSPEGRGATYKTISIQLAEDVRFLLLRLGVPTSISQLPYEARKGSRLAYQISVTDTVRFAEMLNGHLHHGGKAAEVALMAGLGKDMHSRARRLGSHLPVGIIQDLVRESGVSVRPVFEAAGLPRAMMSRAGMNHVGYGNQVRLALALDSPKLHRLTAVQWVKVVSQEAAAADELVFEIAVDGVHSIIVNGVAVRTLER